MLTHNITKKSDNEAKRITNQYAIPVRNSQLIGNMDNARYYDEHRDSSTDSSIQVQPLDYIRETTVLPETIVSPKTTVPLEHGTEERIPQSDSDPGSGEQSTEDTIKSYAEKHLEILGKGLSEAPDVDEPYHWLRSIPGGGRDSFSGKRDSAGKIKTDMGPGQYRNLENLTEDFYNTADELMKAVTRRIDLKLYRGICIPKISIDKNKNDDENKILEIIKGYNDVIPSSTSWSIKTPEEFSEPSADHDGVIFYMTVPRDFPLIMLSVPDSSDKVNANSQHSLCILNQKEVLAGAFKFSSIDLLRIEECTEGRRFHVEVTLEKIPPKDVIDAIRKANPINKPVSQGPPENLSLSRSLVKKYFGIDVDNLRQGQTYEHKEYKGVKYKCTNVNDFAKKFEIHTDSSDEGELNGDIGG